MESKKSHGTEAEDLTQKLCEDVFHRDFVVRSPRYSRKGGAKEEEVSDFLVLHRDQLLSIQVKSRLEGSSNDQVSDTQSARIERTVQEAIDQLKTTKRAISANRLSKVTTLRGVEVPFDCSHPWSIIGIVVIRLKGQELLSREDRIQLSQFALMAPRDMPAHVFLYDDFVEVADELDTVADLLTYLEARFDLFVSGKLASASELDLLAAFRTQYPLIEEARRSEDGRFMIASGAWDRYRRDNRDDIANRRAKNQSSATIDHMINFLHTSVGFIGRGSSTDKKDRDYCVPGTVKDYITIITELAALRRIERRALGDLMIQKTHRANEKEYSYGVIVLTDESVAFLIVASRYRDEMRRRLLLVLAHSYYCTHQPTRLLGIATDPSDVESRYYDAVFIGENYVVEDRKERELFLRIGRQRFAPPRSVTLDDWS